MNTFPTRILLATDGSERANLAAMTAIDLARATGSQLDVIAVGATFPETAVYRDFVDEASEDLKKEAQGVLDAQVKKIEDAGGEVAGTHLRMDERKDEAIVHLAEDIEAGLIVIGSRGYGGMRRALLGNVADSVVHHAHCPVLVVRPTEGVSAPF